MTVDDDIIRILEREHRATPSQIAVRLDKSASQIWQRLEILRLKKIVKRVHRGIYELTTRKGG